MVISIIDGKTPKAVAPAKKEKRQDKTAEFGFFRNGF